MQANSLQWSRIKIKILVTGKGEEKFIELLFKPLLASGFLDWEPPRRIQQLTPTKEQLKVAGTEKKLIGKRDEEIGVAARAFLASSKQNERRILVLLDDLEGARSEVASSVFNRYRDALDVMLLASGLNKAASVHFLRNMLEAYYFSDVSAINLAMNVLHPAHGKGDIPACAEDVENIPHPKNELKKHFGSFDEISDGKAVMEKLNVETVLMNPETCRALRTLFNWCLGQMKSYAGYTDWQSAAKWESLTNGKLWEITQSQ